MKIIRIEENYYKAKLKLWDNYIKQCYKLRNKFHKKLEKSNALS